MKERIGTYVKQKIGGEFFEAYIPTKLPPKPEIDLKYLYPLLEKAVLALSELNSIQKTIPNTALFLFVNVRKEALLSSQIEGTQSSFSDLLLFENDQKPNIEIADVEEVSNYVKALNYGIEKLNQNFPLCLRLIKEMHAILLSGTRGSSKYPGEFRKSQNWIGGTKPGNALFVPPPVENLLECLRDFENFLHYNGLPSLVKAGIAHLQFETIHPFLDGNGRLGRLLISILLCQEGILDQPILYLSLYLKQNRQIYYRLLDEVRTSGNWETWLEFFLEGIIVTSHQAIKTTININKLFEENEQLISNLGRIRFSCKKILEYLKKIPQVKVPTLAIELSISAPTARTALNKMVNVGILQELDEKKRDKIYVYKKYLNLLEEGATPLKI